MERMKLIDKYGNDLTTIAKAEICAKRAGDTSGAKLFRRVLKTCLK